MNVREYWTVLREDKWLVGSVLVVCVAIAAAVALLLPRTYTSTAIFYVASPQTTLSSSDSYQGAQLATQRVKSYSELLTGPRVAADASTLLGGRPSAEEIQRSISADSVAETVVLNLGVTESTPQDAQLVGTAVATSFTRLVNSIESTGQPVNRPIVSTELIYPPTLPTFPAGPGTTMLLAAGVLARLVLGLGAALGRRALRRAVDTSETLETALGAPVLAAVPGLPRRPDRPALLAEPAPGRRGRRAARARDRAAAVRRLRTAVTASAHGRRCLVIAGVRAEQGTTTVALDLAVALAMAGESVLLVDADLQRPALARRLDLAADRGLATVLDGGPVDHAVQHWAPGGLDVLAGRSRRRAPRRDLGDDAGRRHAPGAAGHVLLGAAGRLAGRDQRGVGRPGPPRRRRHARRAPRVRPSRGPRRRRRRPAHGRHPADRLGLHVRGRRPARSRRGATRPAAGAPDARREFPASEPATVPARQPRTVRRGAAKPTPNATSAAHTPSAASTVAVRGVGAHVSGRVTGVPAAQPAAASVEKHHLMPSWIGSGAHSALQERPSTRSRSDATGADRVVFPTPHVRSRDDVPRPTASVAPLGDTTRAAVDPAVQRRVIGAAAEVLTVRHRCGVDAAYALILERARNTATPTSGRRPDRRRTG